MKKTVQDSHCRRAVYLLRNPNPIQSPTRAQFLAVPSDWMARHPANIASTQKRASSGSMVMRIDPPASMGVTLAMATSQNPARAVTCLEKNLKATRLPIAEHTGEKK